MSKTYTTRIALALGFVGAVALAGAAFGQAGNGGSSGDGFAHPAGFGRMHHGGPGLRHDIVTGTMKVQTDNGFVTRRVDTGEITEVGGSTITIARADEETVSVTATDDTSIRRDGEEAEAGDLQAGDRAHLIQIDDGGGFVLRAVFALSPEARAEREAALEERRARHQERRERLRERFREFRAERGSEGASA